MTKLRWAATVLAAAAFLSGRCGAAERTDGMRFIPDVPGQFRALTEHPDALGFHITTTPDPSSCKHYQAIVRVDGADGTPFFLMTKSGNTPDIPLGDIVCDDSPGETGNGNLVVFRMDSRNKTGERMRSNRFAKHTSIEATVPPDEDRATIYFTVVEGGLVFRDGPGGLVPRTYQHPGGMQVVGHVLALAMEHRRDPVLTCITACSLNETVDVCTAFCNANIQYDRASSPTLVMLFDVSNPEDPRFLSQFAPMDEHGQPLTGCDGMAVTPLPGGRYLMAVTPGFDVGDPIYFYRSLPLADCDQPGGDCTLANPAISWEFVGKVNAPDTKDPMQALHFLREGSIDGDLYLAGSNGAFLCPSGDCDRINLFHVDCETPDCAPGESIGLTVRYRGQRISTSPSTGGDGLANLAAAAGFYESPSGELLFYATEHDNDGPDGTVNAGEWRHQSIVREDSPTYLPRVVVDEAREVDEGGDLLISGQAKPPITKAWIQLYTTSGHSLTVDYDDEGLDDFDAFWVLDPTPPSYHGFANDASSWRWYAPPSCPILPSDVVDVDLAFFNGERVRTLAGTGHVEHDDDLSLVSDDLNIEDMYERVDRVHYPSECDDYYGGPFALFWDVENDGHYLALGNEWSFDASELDGPSTVQIPVEARHATVDGPAGQATVTITIRNVPPTVAPLVLTDGAGNRVGVDVPYVLTNVPVTASTTFTDPGIPDHQTAELDWGDGVVDLSSTFVTFSDAYGGMFGQVAHQHAYAATGAGTVTLTVVDDDGGVGGASADVTVVSPEQALLDMIARIDALLATTSNRIVRGLLLQARKALAGAKPGGKDGALGALGAGHDTSALVSVYQAVAWLQQAQAAGSDVGVLITIGQQLILALSAT